MQLMEKEAAEIWRLLIPPRHWLFSDELPRDEFIFTYRGKIYFVNNDGSVLSMEKPACLELMKLGDLLDHLVFSDDTYDFDDNGIFDIGTILRHMGYVVPTDRKQERGTYLIEIVNTLDPDVLVIRYELRQVSFVFALYHAMMRCRELNEKSGWESEHEVKEISRRADTVLLQ
ncbi:hypothetical protein [Brevibacillus massiliensis]|jgi:hypothetical protein|uniref:hypothetical protein n=1 Tax=Brevibacillus massiliensis TaxID=1118054 RepID=UPI0002ECC7C0|nr:hypothetical protein [Brevibacillus massiliensis]